MVGPIAQFILSLGTGGRILNQGSVSDALVNNPTLVQEEEDEKEWIEKAEMEIDPSTEKKPSGTLIAAENIAEGRVTWVVCKYTFSHLLWCLA